MAIYNLTELGNSETISDLVLFSNEASNGVLVMIFILVIFFVMLMVFKKWEFDEAITTASFLTFILSSLLSYGGFLPLIFPLGFLALLAFGAFYMFVVKRN